MTQTSILEKDETSSSCGQLQLQFSVFIILLINIDIYRSTQRSKHFDQQHKGVKVLTFVNIINQSNEIHYVLCCRDISGISTTTTMFTIPASCWPSPSCWPCPPCRCARGSSSSSWQSLTPCANMPTMSRWTPCWWCQFSNQSNLDLDDHPDISGPYSAPGGEDPRESWAISGGIWGKKKFFQRYLFLPWAFLDIIQSLFVNTSWENENDIVGLQHSEPEQLRQHKAGTRKLNKV